MTMATTEKIRRDIEKVREKITEQQKRLRALEAQLAEEENLEIVRMVKAVKMDNKELTAFLKAYASGLITLPAGSYLCADCTEDERSETLGRLLRRAEADYGVSPRFTLQIVVISGILKWNYRLQVPLEADGGTP